MISFFTNLDYNESVLNPLESTSCQCFYSKSTFFSILCLESYPSTTTIMGRLSQKAVLKFQRPITCLEYEMEKTALRSSNSNLRWWNFVQFFRAFQCRVLHIPAPTTYAWAQKMIELEIRRCEIVQRESFLIVQCCQSKEHPQHKLDEWHEELKSLDQDYWSIERLIYDNDVRLTGPPRSPVTRAYVFRKEKPQWYLCRWLNKDCANRGGCCGRACGCCQKPRSVFRLRGHGHCTKFCGCCRQARGFELDEEQQKQCQPTFDLTSSRSDDYSRCILFVYVFGYR